MTSPNPAGPRPWLLAAPVPDGPWRLLLYLHTYGPHWQPGDDLPAHGEVKAWPTRKTCAADLGRPLDTVKGWIKWLTRHGWILREGNVWSLSSGGPCPEWAEAAKGRAVKHTRPGSTATPTGSDQTRVHADPPGGPHTPGGRVHSHPAPGPQPPPYEPTNEPAKGTCQEPASTSADERDQRAFALVADEPDELTRLISEHERLRLDALASHGRRRTKLPGASSKPGKSLRARARKALHELGLAKCLELLGWQAKRWREDPGQLTYSTDSVWSPGSVRYAVSQMSEGPRTRQGSGQRTGWEVGANDDDNIAPLLPAGEDPFDCERLTATRRVC